MSREGWILKQAFDILHNCDKGLQKSHYLYGSRRAIRVAGFRNKGDIMALAGEPYQPGIALDQLIKGRFGIEISQNHIDFLAAEGITPTNRPLYRSFADREIWNRTCQILSDEILDSASIEREAYEQYLRESGVDWMYSQRFYEGF